MKLTMNPEWKKSSRGTTDVNDPVTRYVVQNYGELIFIDRCNIGTRYEYWEINGRNKQYKTEHEALAALQSEVDARSK